MAVLYNICLDDDKGKVKKIAKPLTVDGRPARMPLASGRTARKGFHRMASGQDTQDHQDTQDVAGPQVRKREALESGL